MKENEKIMQAAEIYRQLKLQIRELEKQAAPYKAILKEHAELVNRSKIDLGPVAVQKRTRQRHVMDKVAITPEWLMRIRKGGYSHIATVTLDPEQIVFPLPPRLREYLEEIGYTTSENVTYIVRLQ